MHTVKLRPAAAVDVQAAPMYIKKQTENPSAAYFLSSRTFDSISISLLHESPYIKRAVYTRRLNHSSTEADYRTRIPSGDQAAHAAVAGARSSQAITNTKISSTRKGCC